MLRLARRWGYLDQAPEIEVPKRPSGRLRYLELDEIARLLAACRESRNRYLLAIVTIAVTIALYKTKNGKPRGVPINREVYDALTELQPDAAQRRAGLLFTKPDQRAWGQNRTAFTVALERAKIPGVPTFATCMASSGSPTTRCPSVRPSEPGAPSPRHRSARRLSPTVSAHAQHMNAVQSDSALLASRKAESLKDAPVAQVDRAAVS